MQYLRDQRKRLLRKIKASARIASSRWHHRIKDKRTLSELLTLCGKNSLTKKHENSDTLSENVYETNVYETDEEPVSADELVADESVSDVPTDATKVANVTNDSLSIDRFQTWLQSADGGLKSVKSARQHAFQVSVVVATVDAQSQPLQLLHKHLLQEKFLKKYVQEKNSYLEQQRAI